MVVGACVRFHGCWLNCDECQFRLDLIISIMSESAKKHSTWKVTVDYEKNDNLRITRQDSKDIKFLMRFGCWLLLFRPGLSQFVGTIWVMPKQKIKPHHIRYKVSADFAKRLNLMLPDRFTITTSTVELIYWFCIIFIYFYLYGSRFVFKFII